MKKNKINFAVVGCGRIGKKHIDLIENNPRCNLVALIDTRDKKLLDMKFHNIPFFNNLDMFFKSNLDVDVVNIATPNGLHSLHAIKCLENNKHVVVEKPLALLKVDAEKIIHKSIELKKHVFIVMQNRYSPLLIWLRKILEDRILGEIFIVQVNCFWNRNEKYYKNHPWHGKKDLDGGTLFTQFSHFIDIIYWLFGDIENIVTKLYNFNHRKIIEFEDSGSVLFDFCKGGLGIINYTTSVWGKNLESSMTVIGKKGSIKISGQYMDKVEFCNIINYDLTETNPPNNFSKYKVSVQNHMHVINNVIDVLQNGAEINTNALAGLKVTEIIEKIYKANSNDYEKK
ncbi:MAG: oxidoreductase [Parcubacteria group bacterium]|jgi:predicted dehydrogenase|nr:oxidoreductase [Parcubacteria group bacterium]|tara:strand:+ start:2874 stop:3899 length:1026 start_codon:yes stop_codon:yes gene_type:complete